LLEGISTLVEGRVVAKFIHDVMLNGSVLNLKRQSLVLDVCGGAKHDWLNVGVTVWLPVSVVWNIRPISKSL